MKKVKVVATENGPYKVVGVPALKNARYETLETSEEMYLCRCGGSSNKPYCDGTHKKNGFSGAEDTSHIKNETISYEGASITIYDNRNICSHRGYCTGELPTVFKEMEPWIDPDGDTVDKIIALCDKCPSGALSYSLNTMSKSQGPNTSATNIRLSEKHFGYHGPYDVSGPVEIEGQIKRAPELQFKTTLCRCGHSKNKPYCSGEHYNVKFIDLNNTD